MDPNISRGRSTACERKFRSHVWLFILLVIIQYACSADRAGENNDLSEAEIKNRMADARKVMLQKERKDIDDFIARHHFSMDSTGTGLRYHIYSTGEGVTPKPHDAVVISYTVWLLTGQKVYEITGADPDTLPLAEGKVIDGVEEALYRMPVGSKARLVIPAHLAYGMIGDENKIPGATPLYYDLHLVSLNP